MDADNQAIQTILLGLLEEVYAAVDSCETAKEIWECVRHMMIGSDIEEQEKKTTLFNEWEKFTSTDGQIQNIGGNGGNQFGQYARQVAQNQEGYNAWQNGGIQVAQNAVQNAGVQNGVEDFLPYDLRICYQQSIIQAGSPALHETNADGRVDSLATYLGDTLKTLFVTVGFLATLNLDFATTDVAPKLLDFA
nr:ribonuclease H-like domain-containing protein [Tanacetum cinerariifolium]